MRYTLRLTVDVTFEIPEGAPADTTYRLRDNLLGYMAQDHVYEVVEESEASIVIINPSVEEL